MTDTPIHDELQRFLDIDTGEGNRKNERVGRPAPAPVPMHAPARHQRA